MEPHQRIADQRGLVTVRSLLEAGMTRDAIRWRVGRTWRVALPGVVQTFTGALDPGQRLIAAALYAGEPAVLTGWGACRELGLRNDTGDPYLVFVVPPSRGARSFRHIRVLRSTQKDLRVQARGVLTLSSSGRAVADAARWTNQQDRADALVIEAVQRGMTSVAELTHWLGVGNARGSRTLRTAIDRAASGAWSVPEADLLRLLAKSKVLPPVAANARLFSAEGQRLVTPDGWVDDVGLALMVHSRAHHFDIPAWEATITGDSGLALHGVTVLGVTPRQIRDEPAAVVARIEQTYLALRSDGRRARVRVE